MGRPRGVLKKGDSTNLYIPQDISEDVLKWMNEQMYLNKSIFVLINEKVKDVKIETRIEELVKNEISKVLGNINIKELIEEKESEINNQPNIDNEHVMSKLKMKVLQGLEL